MQGKGLFSMTRKQALALAVKALAEKRGEW